MTRPGALGSNPSPKSAPPSDRSPWNWLLAVPVIVPLLTSLFNFDKPRIVGFPAFYWIQMAFVPLAVVCVVLVYRLTKKG